MVVKGDLSFLSGHIDLVIDHRIIETGIGSFVTGAGIDHPSRPGPVDRPETHGAGFAGSIEVAVGELIIPEGFAGIADGHDFGMGRGIIGRSYLVAAFSD